MNRNVWLLPYSNFEGSDYNPSKGLAVQVRKTLLAKKEKQYVCRIKRVGVNIYAVDEAIDEVEFLDNSSQLKVDVIIAFGLGSPDGLFKFEHTGTAERNNISGQFDIFGRSLGITLKEYDDVDLKGKKAGWYSNETVHKLVRNCEKHAGQMTESPGAGSYLCGYMTQKLAASPTLTNKSFFIHTQNYLPTEENDNRNKAGSYIADFIESFCDLSQ